MKVSVIIPSYNRARTLGRALDSVFAQTHKNLEVIVVDDGSTDGTDGLVKNYDVIYHKTKNRGVSAARNAGFSLSRGEWIALLDSDDEWLPHKIETQLEFARKNPGLSLVHGEEIWVRNGRRVNPMKKHQKSGGWIFEKCLPLCLISPSAAFIKRHLWHEMGGFDEEFIVCEDYDLWLKVTSLYEVGFVEDPLIIKYGGHDDQLSARYKAMDYWRVRALERILEIRELSIEQRNAVLEVMLQKAAILKQGYLKHHNTENLAYVEKVLTTYAGA